MHIYWIDIEDKYINIYILPIKKLTNNKVIKRKYIYKIFECKRIRL